ncbi:hypothetical protein G9A89_001885 [Geosiphon pyriformis]|nr:hypothetical protein G9A89_001885 [Geosiphon pyriformis]
MRVRSALRIRLRPRQGSPAQVAQSTQNNNGQEVSRTTQSTRSAFTSQAEPFSQPNSQWPSFDPDLLRFAGSPTSSAATTPPDYGEVSESNQHNGSDSEPEDTEVTDSEIEANMEASRVERRDAANVTPPLPLPPTTAALLSQMQRDAKPDNGIASSLRASNSFSSSSTKSPSLTTSSDSIPMYYHSSNSSVNFLSLPSELITRVACNLNLTEYSSLSRTCKSLSLHFQQELIHYLKNVYGLSVRTGSLVLFAYTAHLQYRAPRLLERIFDEFFIDAPDTQTAVASDSEIFEGINSEPKRQTTKPSIIKTRHQDPNWPMYWSVLYSLDKQPNYLPPVMHNHSNNEQASSSPSCCSEDHGICTTAGMQLNQNFFCYKCATTSYTGSETGPSPNSKIQFLEKYAARMNAKFALRNSSGRVVSSSQSHNGHSRRNHDWHLADIRQKKTYRMLIMQNIRYGEVALLRFYLEKYGAPVNGVVRMTVEEQIYLQQDRELSTLLTKHGIRIVLAD